MSLGLDRLNDAAGGGLTKERLNRVEIERVLDDGEGGEPERPNPFAALESLKRGEPGDKKH